MYWYMQGYEKWGQRAMPDIYGILQYKANVLVFDGYAHYQNFKYCNDVMYYLLHINRSKILIFLQFFLQ